MIALLRRPTAALLFLILAASPASGQGQGHIDLEVSNASDFNTPVTEFAIGDVIYFRVAAPNASLDQAAFQIRPKGNGDRVSGDLVLDSGFYGSSVPVSDLQGKAESWEVTVELTSGRARFRAGVTIQVERSTDGGDDGDGDGGDDDGDGGGHQTIELRGKVEATGASSLTVAGREIQVIDRTRIVAPNGTVLADLLDQTVEIEAVETADGTLVAVVIKLIASDRQSVSLKGKITQAASEFIVVKKLELKLTSTTIIQDEDGRSLTAADLKEGMHVSVDASKADGEWAATQVVVRLRASASDDDREEIEGPVTTVTDTELVVGDFTFALTDQTHFAGGSSLADLAPGDQVEVEYVEESGRLIALRVKKQNGNGRNEIDARGAIDALGAETFGVDGVVFVVNTDTEFESKLPFDITFADLAIGVEVEVEASVLDGGSLLATRVRVKGGMGDMQELEGLIDSMSDSSLLVSGTDVQVSDVTDVKGERGSKLTVADLQVGETVRVHAVAKSDGSLFAVKIKVLVRYQDDDVEIAGAIAELNADLRTLAVGNLSFQVTDDTDIRDRSGDELFYEGLSLGMTVKIEGFESDQGLVAAEISVKQDLSIAGRLTGPVTEAASDAIVVAGTRFIVDADTRIDTVIPAIGDPATVRFRHRADGSLYAERIRPADPGTADQVTHAGKIEVIDGFTLTVSGVLVDFASAVLLDENALPISATALAVGQRVLVSGTVGDAGLVAATLAVQETIIVAGVIAGKLVDRFRTAGLEIGVSSNTDFSDGTNQSIALEDIPEGSFVEVVAVTEVGGLLQADLILVQASASASTTANESADLPDGFVLHQNYPNPFNPVTMLAFELAARADVTLTVFDLLGRRVQTLVSGVLPAGSHEVQWGGQLASGLEAPSGLYLYTLTVGQERLTRSMTLIR